MNESARLAIVLSHPTQYYSPWFRWLQANTSLTFRVFYLSDTGLKQSHDEKFGRSFAWDIDLASGYEWEVVPNLARKPDTLRFNGLVNPALFPRLRDWKPDAILVFGYKYRTHLRLLAWARLNHIPLIFRGDSHLIGRPRLAWKSRIALRLVYRQFAAVTYVGAANRDYFRAVGVPDDKLFLAPHAVEQSRFVLNAETRDAAKAQREKARIPADHRTILFCAKMISSKQPRELFRAFREAAIERTHLILAGDGPEKISLEEEVARSGATNVTFLPFANQSEMPVRYAMADIFALPSRGVYETWGLSVNEAMHMERPCLVSDQVGCQRDLVQPGETGWVFPADDFQGFVSCVQDALSVSELQLRTYSAAAHARAKNYSYARAGAGLLQALESILR